MKRQAAARVLLGALVVGGIIWAATSLGEFSPAALEQKLRQSGPLAPLIFVLAYIAGTVLFLPGSVFSLLGGVLFGPVWGSVLNLLAATVGATVAFLIARYVAADWVTRRTGGKLKEIVQGVEAEGWRFVALTRLVPLFPFNLLNYALGLTRIRLDHYVLASLICMAPGAVAYTWLGHAGREIAAGSETALRSGLLALGLLAAIALLPRLTRRIRGSTEVSKSPEWVEGDELQQARRGDVLVIDVRSPAEFTGPLGHIPGARNIPLDQLEHQIGGLVPGKEQPLVLVCKTDMRSAKAADRLKAVGYRHVSVLRGGMVRWNQEGWPSLTASQTSGMSVRRQR